MRLLFIILLLYMSSVFSQETVPSVKYLFDSRQSTLSAGKIFAGKIVEIVYSDPHPLTGEKRILFIKVGDSLSEFIMVGIPPDEEENLPEVKVGDSVFIQVGSFGMILYPDQRHGVGPGKVILGNYKIENQISESEKPKIKTSITVDEYFEDNIPYGSNSVIITGKVDEFDIKRKVPRITLISSKNKEITCYFDASYGWPDDEVSQLKVLKPDMIITVRGVFEIEIPAVKNFSIKRIIKIDDKTQSSSQSETNKINSDNMSPEKIQNKDVILLVTKQTELDEKCRGGSSDNPETFKACEERDNLIPIIQSKGWCYGKNGQDAPEMEWHPCTSQSIR